MATRFKHFPSKVYHAGLFLQTIYPKKPKVAANMGNWRHAFSLSKAELEHATPLGTVRLIGTLHPRFPTSPSPPLHLLPNT